ncbi:hypothetical protein Despr_2046 [Desulfobulbus propionicus DSM 2032]|uniref:Uncharacterized protein n=1 Tax=Desulfobulbus propionicus (strain ATCC 33891 / DSM 2032 / VKM B-1956 / 1pr3) TaxID=577650 RepID=A0A7U3YMN7_DESPD|nr:hypothetical protein [Desulfobulbus propionicus]ADW18194.1 hypothetical protein Despr_2046 [Desulfobulbus propionicus DSM 2032]
MEQLVAELKKIVSFKETTTVGDIVLIAAKSPQMLVYALVGDIERDQTRKEEWWHVTLHLLSIPVQTVIWTLRTPQFTGQETFTMGGEGRFIKAVRFDPPASEAIDPTARRKGQQQGPRKPGLRIVK